MNEFPTENALAPESGGSPIFGIIYLALVILVIVSMWKVYTKAGKPGWASIIPIYNLFVLIEISGKPLWFIILFFIPVANLVALILVSIGVAETLGKGAGFGIGLAFLPFIFYPILAFTD